MINQQTIYLNHEQNQICLNAVAWLKTHLGTEVNLKSDTRKLMQGDVFIAYAVDVKHDGRTYIRQAYECGAGAVMWQENNFELLFSDLPNYAVPELNYLAGYIADLYYGQPSSQMQMIGVTGTNGKTSCAEWLAQLFDMTAQKCAVIGTLGAGFVGVMAETGFTTPQAVEVHCLLRNLYRQDARAVVMEVSSHALEQGRVNGVCFDIALFTNLSQDHLDYHNDMLSYESAKARLFEGQTLKAVVVNLDDAAGRRMAVLAKKQKIRVIGYGLSELTMEVNAYLQARDVRVVGGEIIFQLNVDGLSLNVTSGLLGDFNVMNLLGVLGVFYAMGHNLSEVVLMCRHLSAAPGRMQRFGGEGQPLVVVDFAHTPDALEKTLTVLRPVTELRGGRLICVFGCGGDRDVGKRPQMGRLAAMLSDSVWVTSDNPRSESPEEIVAQIAVEAEGVAQINIEVDRRVATKSAILTANRNDVILVAGKGHEAYQEIQGVKHPYSDLVEVINALALWIKK